MSLLVKPTAADISALLANQTTMLASDTTMKASDTTLLSRLTALRAGYLDALNRGRPSMIFPSLASVSSLVELPNSAADLAFPSVVIADIPSGAVVALADYALVIGSLFDTSGSENQIDQASKTIRMQKGAGWATAIVALTFANNGLQTPASAYRGGPVLFGGVDISAMVIGNGTYQFQSDESTHGEGVTVTAGTIECLDTFSVIRVWFN